jgi:hypothetical protein
MMYVSANEKAVSLNLHRYTTVSKAEGAWISAFLVNGCGAVLGGAVHVDSP